MVPTSRRTAPDRESMSGIRNPPPISTSSPRDTRTPRPVAMVFNPRTTAAALLFTTSASGAPVSSCRSSTQWTYREPRTPASSSNSRLE